MISSPMLEELTATKTIDQAYTWLCTQRIKHPANADIWSFRFHWEDNRAELATQLRNGSYHFEPMQLIRKRNGEQIVIWSSRDSLVLKMLTLVLQHYLPVSAKCTHIKGNAG